MRKIIYIIADDLTGANDTGVQFSKHGYTVTVKIENKRVLFQNNNKHNVDVIDTETRESSPDEAIKKINKIFSEVSVDHQDIMYKKIDSTMRGNVGKEIEIMLDIFDKDLCILTPTFSESNRFTIGGYLIVDNIPLGCSEYNQLDIDSGEASYIPSILKNQTDLSVGKIELKEVIKGQKSILKNLKQLYEDGKKIIVIDSTDEIHLSEILKATDNIKENILYSGSAGLANTIAKKYSIYSRENEFEFNNFPFLIVNGSRNSISNKQIDYLENKKDSLILNIDVEKIIAEENGCNYYFKKIISDYRDQDYIIIRPDPQFTNTEVVDRLLKRNNISFRTLGEKIRDMLGILTKNIISKFQIDNAVVIGGDTLIGLCNSMGISELKIIGEVVEGVPITEPIIENNHKGQLKLISKAGGFGSLKTINTVIDNIIRRKKTNNE